ncbi:hypothetical protein ABG768_010434, partial [Culter alburnus]
PHFDHEDDGFKMSVKEQEDKTQALLSRCEFHSSLPTDTRFDLPAPCSLCWKSSAFLPQTRDKDRHE